MKSRPILILVKKSSYEHYANRSKNHQLVKNYPSKEVMRRFKATHDCHYRTLEIIQRHLKVLGLDFNTNFRGTAIDYSKYDLVITVGGDGTFLEAAHHLIKQKIFGVNSNPQWSVGNFCAADAQTFLQVMNQVIAHKERSLFLKRYMVRLNVSPRKYLVLNDVLVCSQNPAAMSRYVLKVNDILEEQRSSGIWLSTAAGSTGAIKSAGAKVLPITSDKFQYMPRELYQGFGSKYRLRGGCLMKDDNLEITSLMRDGFVYIDGSHIRLPFPIGDKLMFMPSKFPLRVVWK